jgi:putative membrane protein
MHLRHFAIVLSVVAALTAPAAAAPAAARRLDPDAAFLRTAHQGNLAQMALGRITVGKATSPAIRRLGARFAADSARLDRAVRAAAYSLDIELDEEPNATVQQSIAVYRSAPDADFDQFFVSSQAMLHDKAARLVRAELNDGDEVPARRIAQRTLVVIRKHRAVLGHFGQ